MSQRVVVFAVALGISAAVWGQDAVLFEDINTHPAGSSPRSFVAMGGWVYFTAERPDVGRELWRTDGAQTELVKDICPGDGSALVEQLTVVGNTLYVTNGREFWASDGSDPGTVLLRTFSATPESLVVFKGLVAFVADKVATGREIWVSDGTAGGTVEVKDVCPGGCDGVDGALLALGQSLYFGAYDGAVNGLWATDGTPGNTFRVKDIAAGPTRSDPGNLIAFNGLLYFTAYEPSLGRELWRSDGSSSGTSLVRDIHPGPASSSWPPGCGFAGPAGLAPWAICGEFASSAIGGRLYFSANDGTTGCELWVSDPAASVGALLRNTEVTKLDPVDPQLATILPLDAVADEYRTGFTTGDADPELAILTDELRPLVFYALTANVTLKISKTAGRQVRIYF